MKYFKSKKSFTLIEILVVLAIVAILSTVVIMTLNPAELLKQARDSTRLSDLSTLNTALAAYSADVTNGFMGTSTKVYVSIPDTSPTCANLGLPSLPSGWFYNCVTATSSRLTNGNGWVPVNFTGISFGSPLSSLPVDPVNVTSSGIYYTYVSGGSFQLSSRFESVKYQPQASKTNDYDPGLYVIGNNTTIAPFVGGLVGWWKFDGDATDSSGFGNTGTWHGTGTHYATGKVGSSAGQFNGTDDYVDIVGNLALQGVSTNQYSWSFWVKSNYLTGQETLIYHSGYVPRITTSPYSIEWYSSGSVTAPINVLDNNWHHVVLSLNNRTLSFYGDGQAIGSGTVADIVISNLVQFGITAGSSAYLSGSLDDIRIYNRALSAAEVAALYNAAK